MIINTLNETQDFDEIKTVGRGQRWIERKQGTHAKVSAKQSCSYYGSSHPPRWFLAYGKKCAECSKVNHFRQVSRSVRNRKVHNLEQEPDQYQKKEDHIDMVNINSFNCNNKCSVITATLKVSPNQVRLIVPYNINISSNENIMPSHIYQFFPRVKNNN